MKLRNFLEDDSLQIQYDVLDEVSLGSYKNTFISEPHLNIVYKNPVKTELIQMYKNYSDPDFRFLASAAKKSLFIWYSELEIHEVMHRFLVRKGHIPQGPMIHTCDDPAWWDSGCYGGYLDLEPRGILNIREVYPFNGNLDWSFMKKYISKSSYNEWVEDLKDSYMERPRF